MTLITAGFDISALAFRPAPGSLLEPVFPGYLFVRFDRDLDDWRPIGQMAGIRRLISSSPEQPSPLRAGVFEHLVDLYGADGTQREAPFAAPVGLKVGERFEVLDGPFTSFTGICAWSSARRVKLLLDIFGRSSEVDLDRKHVGAA